MHYADCHPEQPGGPVKQFLSHRPNDTPLGVNASTGYCPNVAVALPDVNDETSDTFKPKETGRRFNTPCCNVFA